MSKKTLKKKTIMDTAENGYVGLKFSGGSDYGVVYEDKRADFQFPTSIATFQYMAQDPIIAASYNLIDVMIGKLEWKFEVPDNATGNQKLARDFLNYCMNNMSHTWKSFIQEVGSYRTYGFHVAEKVFKEINPDENKKFAGKFKWEKLPTRSQSTIQGWVFDESIRELKAIKQNLSNLTNTYQIKTDDGLIEIPINKALLFSYKKTRGNPEGHSPLKDCYQPWTYKKTIESYEAVGVAKDLGGVPVLGVDAAWLAKAQADSTSAEGVTLSTLETYMENLHAGEQTYFIMPIAYNDSGKELFKFDLIGVDGGGKQYNTRDIVNGKQLEIMMILLTDILRVGNENHGSFSLAESKQNLTSFGISNHLSFIIDVIQEQLVPQTLKINGFNLTKDKYPTLTHSDLDDESKDELGKLVQRLASTNMIPRDLRLINEILEKGGFKYRLAEDNAMKDKDFSALIPFDEIFTNNESGASQGMEEGLPNGTGSGDKNNSSINLDNAS